MGEIFEDCFNKFDPGSLPLGAMKISRYASYAISGSTTWCHALYMKHGEAAHVFHSAGTRIAASHTGVLTIVFRSGGARIQTSDYRQRAIFNELAVYPDGTIGESHYLSGAHEIVVCGDRPYPGKNTVIFLGPVILKAIWRFIFRLRATGQACECQEDFDTVVRAATDPDAGRFARPVLEALQYLEANWGAGRPPPSIAASAGVSTAYLCRLFRQTCGMSIGAYQRLLRVCRAAGLLWGSSMPINSVAAVCNFSDQSHLTKQMLDLFGVTPYIFRRMAPCIGNQKLADVELLDYPATLRN